MCTQSITFPLLLPASAKLLELKHVIMFQALKRERTTVFKLTALLLSVDLGRQFSAGLRRTEAGKMRSYNSFSTYSFLLKIVVYMDFWLFLPLSIHIYRTRVIKKKRLIFIFLVLIINFDDPKISVDHRIQTNVISWVIYVTHWQSPIYRYYI